MQKQARTSEIVVEIVSPDGETHRLKALLDSGTTSGIVLKKFINKNKLSKFKTKPVKWSTLGGVYHTRKRGQVDLLLPEFSLNKQITWTFHVDEVTNPQLAQYDMIIGDDLMQELGIDLIYSTEVPCIKWEEVEVPMKPRGSLNRESLNNLYSMQSDDPAIIEKAEKRRQVIYDADYSQPDLLEYCTEQKNLSTEEQNMLYNLLKDHPVLFSGGLGKLNIKPVSIELTENAKPYHIRQPFNIPHIYIWVPLNAKLIDCVL